MSVDPFCGVPQFVQMFDGFDDCVIATNRWSPKVEVGSTLISEGGTFLNFINSGAGTAGLSYIESLEHFSRHIRISVDIIPVVFTGERCEASLVLWKDDNNWVKCGIYKDASEGIDSQAYIRASVAGVVSSYMLDAGPIPATFEHQTYTLVLLEHNILIYHDDVYVTEFDWEGLVDYHVRLEAGTQSNGDTLQIRFDNFEAHNYFDFALMRIGLICELLRRNCGNNTAINTSFTLADTTNQIVEFLQADYGDVFDLHLAFNITGAHIDYCRLYDTSLTTFLNQDTVAQDLADSNVFIVPSVGPGVNDYIAFGTLHASKRLDIVMGPGGKLNVGNTIAWKKMNGAGAQSNFTSLTDGTTGFKKDGSVTWTDDLVLDTINGVSAYWVVALISAAGGVTDIPKGSRMLFGPTANTDFNSRAVFGSYLIVEVYRKINGAYQQSPTDIMYFQQSNVSKDISIDLTAFSDTKLVFHLSATPSTTITVPYTGVVMS